MQALHPLLGVTSPRFADVLARCDDAAGTTLRLAAGLARHRIAVATELEREPWAEPAGRVARGVIATDLLRALLAQHGDRIAALVRDVHASFADAVAHWQRVAAGIDDRDVELELDPIWARRWALDSGALARDALIGRLTEASLRKLARFADRYAEGLITDDEAFNHLVDDLAGARIGARFAMPMPPAYLDRHGGLAALDAALARAPGAVIVGPRGSGRHALIATWGRRLATGGPAELRRFGFNTDNFHGGGELVWRGEPTLTFAAVETRCIYVLSRFGSEADAPDAWPAARRFPAYCVDFARDPANEFRLVLVMTPDELARRAEQYPELREFPRIDVPPIGDDELLALWICQAVAVEDRLGIPLPLPRLVDRLAWRSPERRRDFAAHADFACESELAGCERILRAFVRRPLDANRQRRLERRVEAEPMLAGLVDPARWGELVALADALHGV